MPNPLLSESSNGKLQSNSSNAVSGGRSNGGSAISVVRPRSQAQGPSQWSITPASVVIPTNTSGQAPNNSACNTNENLVQLARAMQLAKMSGLPINQLGSMYGVPNVYHQLQQQLRLQSMQRPQPQQQLAGNNQVAQNLLNAFASGPAPSADSKPATESAQEDLSRKYPPASRARSGSSSSGRERTLVVPCRARGMSMEHNFQTAYFKISEDVKHGDGFICSFPDCRNRGVKFLYCVYCKDPVAKRNFRNQHTHADDANDKGKGGKKKTEYKQNPTVNTVISKTKKRKMHRRPHQPVVSEGTLSGTGNSYTEAARKVANCDGGRMEAWEALLLQRPDTDQSDAMSAWLMQVMAVSDLKKRPLCTAMAPKESSETSSSSPGTTESSNDEGGDSLSPTEGHDNDKNSNQGDSGS